MCKHLLKISSMCNGTLKVTSVTYKLNKDAIIENLSVTDEWSYKEFVT